jgi:hypothetical protein
MERKTGLIERNFTLKAFKEIISQAGVVDFFRNKGNFEICYQEDQICCVCEVRDCEGKRWFLYRLRDRRNDGPSFTRSPLTDWNYSGEFDVPPSDGLVVERSRYQGDPSFPLTNRFSQEVAEFIKNPFEALSKPEPEYDLDKWLNTWRLVFYGNDTVFPGQFSLVPFPSNISKTLFNLTVKLLREGGYRYLTSIPTWWHVALSNLRQGFKFCYEEDKKIFEKLQENLRSLGFSNQEDLGIRMKSSWLVMLQFWAQRVKELGEIPESLLKPNEINFVFRDKNGNIITYPLSPERNLWQILTL